jgi:hypothetical protein
MNILPGDCLFEGILLGNSQLPLQPPDAVILHLQNVFPFFVSLSHFSDSFCLLLLIHLEQLNQLPQTFPIVVLLGLRSIVLLLLALIFKFQLQFGVLDLELVDLTFQRFDAVVVLGSDFFLQTGVLFALAFVLGLEVLEIGPEGVVVGLEGGDLLEGAFEFAGDILIF